MINQDQDFQYPQQLTETVQNAPDPLVFATISGAHLYGFPSADSDWDLRGVHVLSLRQVLSLEDLAETRDISHDDGQVELDLVTHDAKKFARLLLTRNGYVLEQLLSPLVVKTSDFHQELIELAPQLVTRFHIYHYLGFTQSQWKLLEKEEQPRVKPLLYAFRTVLTGIHLMKTGQIEANLLKLNEQTKLPFLAELMALKMNGKEKEPLPDSLETYRAEYEKLLQELEALKDSTHLPQTVAKDVRKMVSDWVVRVRLETTG